MFRLTLLTGIAAVVGWACLSPSAFAAPPDTAATKYVKALQYGDGVDPKDPKFGGAGYDAKTRPDLSNTQILLDALSRGQLSISVEAVRKFSGGFRGRATHG